MDSTSTTTSSARDSSAHRRQPAPSCAPPRGLSGPSRRSSSSSRTPGWAQEKRYPQVLAGGATVRVECVGVRPARQSSPPSGPPAHGLRAGLRIRIHGSPSEPGKMSLVWFPVGGERERLVGSLHCIGLFPRPACEKNHKPLLIHNHGSGKSGSLWGTMSPEADSGGNSGASEPSYAPPQVRGSNGVTEAHRGPDSRGERESRARRMRRVAFAPSRSPEVPTRFGEYQVGALSGIRGRERARGVHPRRYIQEERASVRLRCLPATRLAPSAVIPNRSLVARANRLDGERGRPVVRQEGGGSGSRTGSRPAAPDAGFDTVANEILGSRPTSATTGAATCWARSRGADSSSPRTTHRRSPAFSAMG